jgi:hypothetical protein
MHKDPDLNKSVAKFVLEILVAEICSKKLIRTETYSTDFSHDFAKKLK